MRRAGLLLLACLLAASAGAGAQLLSGREHATPKAGLARGAGVLLAGSGVVWAQVGGSVYRSTDRGTRFTLSLRDDVPTDMGGCWCERLADFVGPNDAWLARPEPPGSSGEATRIWRTVDGGRLWRPAGVLPENLSASENDVDDSISFTSARTGYALASGIALGYYHNTLTARLWQTTNGGASWRVVPSTSLPLSGQRYPSSACVSPGWLTLSFATAKLGFISIRGCTYAAPGLWQTTDGGKSWRRAILVQPPGGWPGLDPQASAPQVTSAGAVLDEVSTASGALVVERLGSSDSFSPAGELRTGQLGRVANLDVIDAEHLVLPASDGMWESDDGGASWRFVMNGLDLAALGPLALRLGPGAVLEGVVASAAPMATDDGGVTGPVVLRSTDGGLLWRAAGELADRPGLFDPSFDGVALAPGGAGYLAGRAGIASFTLDGSTLHSVWSGGMPVTSLQGEPDGAAIALTADELLTTPAGAAPFRPASEPRAGGLAGVAFAGSSTAYGVVCASPGAASSGLASSGLGWPGPGSPGELVRSSDGGASWQAASLPPGAGCPGLLWATDGQSQSPGTICLASSRVLYALGGPGEQILLGSGGEPPAFAPPAALYESTDAARSWRRVGAVPGDLILACGDGALWTSQETGLTLPNWQLFDSHDGGRSFCLALDLGPGNGSVHQREPTTSTRCREASAALGDYPEMAAVSARADIVLSACVIMPCVGPKVVPLRLQESTDGGSSWSPLSPLPGTCPPAAAALSTSSTGVVLAMKDSGCILGTQSDTVVLLAAANGGRRWRLLASVGDGSP